MTELSINKHTLQLYSSIKELPVVLSKKMSTYLLQDTGIGSTIGDVDDHLARLKTFVHSDKKQEAIEEIKNLRFNLFTMLSGIHYRSMAFGCLIASVDGQEIKDYSSEAIGALMDKINITEGDVEQYLAEVKKNWIRSEN